MSAGRHITPRIIAYLPRPGSIPADKRISSTRPRTCCARPPVGRRYDNDPGHWQCTDSISQLEAGTGYAARTIKRALDCLELVGLVVTVKHGGGVGTHARGSVRQLYLDPVDNEGTGASWAAPVVTGTSASLARTGASTERTGASNWHTPSSLPFRSSARGADSVDNSETEGDGPEIFYVNDQIYATIGHHLPATVRPSSENRGNDPPPSVEAMLELTNKITGRR